MSPLIPKSRTIYFGQFLVTPQVFHTTPLSFALVNLKPILPGHVLVSPLRPVPRLRDLSPAEVADLFTTVQRVGRMLERVYGAAALNVAVQDGVAAGQTVPHVHAHIIPRSQDDLADQGGGDVLYDLLDGEEGDVGAHLRMHHAAKRQRSKFPVVPDTDRKPRNEEEMSKEAEWFAREMAKETEGTDAEGSAESRDS
ncbi:HIT-like protein [Trichodelitschia bisporula]|uniref:Bis(5'-adenosyl)-triphosphatase n=1 Tax=Trichodelitschia bisporula TaxID=703511 RepID=A0A6G1I4P0_9PEZI|nr:HIT-like protein [Trichodelitschia bisporula]